MYCKDFQSFKKVFYTNLISLRYKQGLPKFFNRNYFFSCIDWIPNNKWIVKGITEEIGKDFAYAKTKIDKLSWLYNYKLLKAYKENLSIEDLKKILNKLDINISSQESILPYIPIKEILQDYNEYFQRFPTLSVIFIVRPDWDVTEVCENYGTHLNISHLGFGIREEKDIYFYHASNIGDLRVEKLKLIDYLYKYKGHRNVKGIYICKCNL